MKHIVALTLLTLAACSPGSAAEPRIEKEPAPTTIAANNPPACSAPTIASLSQSSILHGQAINTLIVARGCGLSKARDVQVSVQSVPFVAVDDQTLVFGLLSIEAVWPYQAEIDVMTPSGQTQRFITYQ